MSFTDSFPNDFCIFSNMEGKLTLHGKPASGAKIVLKLHYYDEKLEPIETVADAEGRFHFPSVWKKLGMKRFVPHEPHASQSIIVTYKGEEYKIWYFGKHTFEEYSELNGVPVNFRCELTDESVPVKLEKETGLFVSKCKWDSIKQKELNK